jgi:hypothetical protein
MVLALAIFFVCENLFHIVMIFENVNISSILYIVNEVVLPLKKNNYFLCFEILCVLNLQHYFKYEETIFPLLSVNLFDLKNLSGL